MANRAAIFDLDGTLYSQRAVRTRMALSLGALLLRSPKEGARVIRALRSYRAAHEMLRHRVTGAIAEEQVALASKLTDMSATDLRRIVRDWFELAPLPHVTAAGAPERVTLFRELRAAGWKIGVLSDYPANHKLEALGLADLVDCVRSAQDEDVNVLKPNPAGLRMLAATMAVEPRGVTYVGDRIDVDGVLASRWGCRFVDITRTTFLHRKGDAAWRDVYKVVVEAP